MAFKLGRFSLDLSQPKIMGVLNCTPDSFSDGGLFIEPKLAISRAEEMIIEGADIIDVGAESTRPGSLAISAEEELSRLLPVVRELVKLNIPISIDTKKTEVMKAVLDLGVDMINDVHGFEAHGALEVIAEYECGICVMHMRGMPENMQQMTSYQNVVSEVSEYLEMRAQRAEQCNIARDRIVVDPGFGFGKTPEQNMLLINNIAHCAPAYPKLIGVSRKSTIGHYLNNAPVQERVGASVFLSGLAAYLGANIVRVHDVRATKDALQMVAALHASVAE